MLLLAAALWVRRSSRAADWLRLIPQLAILLPALLRDRTVPKAARWRVAVAVVYGGQPFNLIPDWIPVVGYLDNAVVFAWALRSVMRLAGEAAVARHWRGTEEDLGRIYQVLRLNRELQGCQRTAEVRVTPAGNAHRSGVREITRRLFRAEGANPARSADRIPRSVRSCGMRKQPGDADLA
jgi:uncharacterized membrane protein YkvA (DUF1232 family)